MGLFVWSRFQFGNVSPQADLVEFIHQCDASYPNTFTTLRSDSAAYNSSVINDCFEHHRYFSITADHDVAVMDAIHRIPANAWENGYDCDGVKEQYDVAQTVHTMEKTKQSFRLVVKRYFRQHQIDAFDGNYGYWIIATNIPNDKKNAQEIILFHQQRGEMEKMIGELKHHYNLDHLPCGQFSANSVYFTIGILAHTITQLLKKHFFGNEWEKKSIRSLRYYWLHVPAKIIFHSRYVIAKVAMVRDLFEQLLTAYLRICAFVPSS